MISFIAPCLYLPEAFSVKISKYYLICKKALHRVMKYNWIIKPYTLLLLFAFLSILPVQAQEQRPIVIARPTWDQNWFHTEIVRLLIKEMGYEVNEVKTMPNETFYPSVIDGKVDFWLSGHLPNHQPFITKDFESKVAIIGDVVPEGFQQGYLIDKKTADSLKIKSIMDFKRQEVIQAYDYNHNGKADLMGCDPGWGCKLMIDFQIEGYGLQDSLEQLSDDHHRYLMMANERIRQGKPALVAVEMPRGQAQEILKNSYWLPVPHDMLPPDLKAQKVTSLAKDLENCLSQPCYTGLPVNYVHIFANKQFLDSYPDIQQLLKHFQIPYQEIARQNHRMHKGEDDINDIKAHAKEWIALHRSKVNQWISNANSKGTNSSKKEPQSNTILSQKKPQLRVLTKIFPPFVMLKNGQYQGFSIDLMNQLAKEMNVDYKLVGMTSMARMLDEVQREAADLAISGIIITRDREKIMDFSHPYYQSGLQIMVKDDQQWSLFTTVFNFIFSLKFFAVIASLIFILTIAAHIIWFIERGKNDSFHSSYFRGVLDAFWWTAVTMTTVGYGDKTPERTFGRMFAIFWMFVSYFIFAYFTATITTSFTLNELDQRREGLEDLMDKKVATLSNSIAEDFLHHQGIYPVLVEQIEDAYEMLDEKKVQAVIYHSPVLKHYISREGKSRFKLPGQPFYTQPYGLALPLNSKLRKPLNEALLTLLEDNTYDRLHKKWFGKQRNQ